jgi:hypothetical protein
VVTSGFMKIFICTQDKLKWRKGGQIYTNQTKNDLFQQLLKFLNYSSILYAYTYFQFDLFLILTNFNLFLCLLNQLESRISDSLEKPAKCVGVNSTCTLVICSGMTGPPTQAD